MKYVRKCMKSTFRVYFGSRIKYLYRVCFRNPWLRLLTTLYLSGPTGTSLRGLHLLLPIKHVLWSQNYQHLFWKNIWILSPVLRVKRLKKKRSVCRFCFNLFGKHYAIGLVLCSLFKTRYYLRLLEIGAGRGWGKKCSAVQVRSGSGKTQTGAHGIGVQKMLPRRT